MRHVSDWYDPIKKVIHVRCERSSTVLLYNIKIFYIEILAELEIEMGINMVVVDTLTDILALPAFLAISDLNKSPAEDLKDHFMLLEKYSGPDDFLYLFTEEPHIDLPSVVQRMRIDCPLPFTKENLRQIINKARPLTRM